MQGFIDESGLFIFLFILFFCVLHRNSRWPPKVAGKRFLAKVAGRLAIFGEGKFFLKIAKITF